MAIVAFTGTNTGKVYEVGKSYVSAGRVYTAQADGSFKTKNIDGRERSVVGSSQSSSAYFFSDGKKSSPLSNGEVVVKSGSSGLGAPKSGSVPTTGNGPGNAGVLAVPGVPPGSAASQGQAAAMADWFAKNGFPAGTSFVKRNDGTYDAATLDYPVGGGATLRTTLMWVGGKHLPQDPTTSDVQDGQSRLGDDNPIVSTVGAITVGGADVIAGGGGYVGGFLNYPGSKPMSEKDVQDFQDWADTPVVLGAPPSQQQPYKGIKW